VNRPAELGYDIVKARLASGVDASAVADEVTRRARDIVTARRWATEDRERAIGTFWREAFDRFEVLLSVATGFAEDWAKRVDASARATAGDARYDAVPTLARRGLQAAHEILASLTAGYPAAAMARWRSAHEMAIVALALAEEAEELARRYLDHQWIEAERTLKAMPPAFRASDTELQAYEHHVVAMAAQARATHTDTPFGRPNGWMATLIPSRQFSELESRFGAEAARMWYRRGNTQTHAGHLGPATQLGNDVGNEDEQIVGPSLVDLEQVGVVAPHTVRALVVALLRLHPIPEARRIDAAIEAIRYSAAVSFGDTAEAVFALRDELSAGEAAT
jgi:hypothetical protein